MYLSCCKIANALVDGKFVPTSVQLAFCETGCKGTVFVPWESALRLKSRDPLSGESRSGLHDAGAFARTFPSCLCPRRFHLALWPVSASGELEHALSATSHQNGPCRPHRGIELQLRGMRRV